MINETLVNILPIKLNKKTIMI